MRNLILLTTCILIAQTIVAQNVYMCLEKSDTIKSGNVRIKNATVPKIVLTGVNFSLYNIKVSGDYKEVRYTNDDFLSLFNVQNDTLKQDSSLNDLDKIIKEKDELYSLYNNLLYGDIKSIYNQYKVLVSNSKIDLIGAMEQKNSLQNKLKPITEYYKNYFTIKFTLESKDSLSKFESLVLKEITNRKLFLDSIIALDNYYQKSLFEKVLYLPVANGDELDAKITLKETKQDGSTIIIPVYARVKGKFKIDFSSGLIIEMLNNDKKFYFKNNDDGTTSTLNEDNETSNYMPKFGIFANSYFQNGRNINYGLSIGLSLTDDSKMSCFLGPSVIVGYNKRLIITGGVSLSPVEQLKGNYSIGEQFDIGSEPDELTRAENKIGLFLAVALNISSTIKSINKF